MPQDFGEERMQSVAMEIDELFNGKATGDDREIGFVLLVFPFGEREGRANYISNGASREDIIDLFRAMIDSFEGQD